MFGHPFGQGNTMEMLGLSQGYLRKSKGMSTKREGNAMEMLGLRCLPEFLLACLLVCVLACLFACLPGCLLACVRACLSSCLLACLRTCLHACSFAYVLACLFACACACLLACVRACWFSPFEFVLKPVWSGHLFVGQLRRIHAVSHYSEHRFRETIPIGVC